MPNYDVECPNCGQSERINVPLERRKDPCDKCGAEVEVLITAATTSKGFEPYFNEGLGVYVTGSGDINKAMRAENADYRPLPTRGDISARRDRIEERHRAAAAHRR